MTMRWQVLGLKGFWLCLVPSRSAVGATRRSHRQKAQHRYAEKVYERDVWAAMVREGAIAEPNQACDCALKISKAAKVGRLLFLRCTDKHCIALMSWQMSMHLTVQSKRRCICAHTESEQLTRLEKGKPWHIMTACSFASSHMKAESGKHLWSLSITDN